MSLTVWLVLYLYKLTVHCQERTACGQRGLYPPVWKARGLTPRFANSSESVDLLAILMGRVLRIQEVEEKPGNAINELQEIARTAMGSYHIAGDDDMREAALDVLRHLPARSESEAALVLKLAEDALDERERGAILEAAQLGNLKDNGVRRALQAGRQSIHKTVREAVEQLLRL